MTTDPRDEILRRHAPLVMVPRFGTLEPLAQHGHRYLAAQNGLWIEVRRAWLHARYPIGETDMRLHFGPLEDLCSFAFTIRDIARTLALFRLDARRAMPNECAAWAVWDEEHASLEYRQIDAAESSPGSVRFDRPVLREHEHLAIDLHSHGAMAPGFSETDDDDDAGEVKFAAVYGGIGTESPAWRWRLCLLGLFREGFPG